MTQIHSMNVTVLGAGSWGTALALLLSDNGCAVTLWAHTEGEAAELAAARENRRYLPGHAFPPSLVVTADPSAVRGADAVVVAIPTQFIRSALHSHGLSLADIPLVVNVSKGIENGSLERISAILEEVAGVEASRYVALTGPSHAEEVARRIPTTVVAASASPQAAHAVQKLFSNNYFRVYTSCDVVGCEIGGALKNVIAISAGIIDGAALGSNTKAALMTRGLAEIARLGLALGAEEKTFAGLSGIGDLFVTCTSGHSRNRGVGERIGAGERLSDILAGMDMVVEGVATTRSAVELARRTGVELPICEQVWQILFNEKAPMAAIHDLMMREYRQE